MGRGIGADDCAGLAWPESSIAPGAGQCSCLPSSEEDDEEEEEEEEQQQEKEERQEEEEKSAEKSKPGG